MLLRRPYFVRGNVLYSPGRAEPLAVFLVPHSVSVRFDFAARVAQLLNHDRHEVIGCAVCNTAFMGDGGLQPDGNGYSQSELAVLRGWRLVRGTWRCPEAECQSPNASATHVCREDKTCPHCFPYVCQCDASRPPRCTAEHGETRTGCLLPRGHVEVHQNLVAAWPDHESATKVGA